MALSKDELNARRRERYWADRQKNLARQKAWRAQNLAQVLTAAKAYREANREKVNAKVAEWGAKNKDKKKAGDADWARRNKERCAENAKNWAKANPEKVAFAKTKHYLARRLDMPPAALPADLIAAQALVNAIRRKVKNGLR
jgi:hypothetical protein